MIIIFALLVFGLSGLTVFARFRRAFDLSINEDSQFLSISLFSVVGALLCILLAAFGTSDSFAMIKEAIWA